MAQISAEKLEHTGSAETKGVALVPQKEQLASTLSRLCQKEKEQSHLSRSPDHEGRERQGDREPYFGEREGDQSGRIGKKEWTPQ